MFSILRLLLPALIPSWRFFDTIAPSPRIEFTLVDKQGDPGTRWSEFRPRPDRLPVASMLRRLLWNPRWNETLFMVSCAEKLLLAPSAIVEHELLTRIAAEIARAGSGEQLMTSAYLRLRIVVIKRQDGQLARRVGFLSATRRLADAGGTSAP